MRCYRAPSAPFTEQRRYHSAFIWLPRTMHTAGPLSVDTTAELDMGFTCAGFDSLDAVAGKQLHTYDADTLRCFWLGA